jgi:hypothetical protein
MAKIISEFEYKLVDAFMYHKDGNMAQAKSLLLKAPSNVHRFQVNKLKQAFLQAAFGMQKMTSGSTNNKSAAKEAAPDTQEQMSASTIMNILFLGNADMNEFYETFKDMLCKNLCFIDGNVPMNSHLFENLTLNEGDLLLGKYLEVFFISSWMSPFSEK